MSEAVTPRCVAIFIAAQAYLRPLARRQIRMLRRMRARRLVERLAGMRLSLEFQTFPLANDAAGCPF